MEETISLQEIYEVIKKRFMFIVACVLGAALIAVVVSYFILTPKYESTTQFIVNQSEQGTSDNMQIDSGMIRTNVELINTYNVIITSSAILNEVIEVLDLDMTTKTLADNITVSNEEDSQVVSVTVKNENPALATDIANATVTVFQEEIVDLMNVDNVKILSEAETKANPTPVEPRPMLNIAIAVVLGGMIGVGLAFLLEYFDTTIKTEKDIEKQLDVPIVGVVSTMEGEDVRPDFASSSNKGGITRVQKQKTNIS